MDNLTEALDYKYGDEAVAVAARMSEKAFDMGLVKLAQKLWAAAKALAGRK